MSTLVRDAYAATRLHARYAALLAGSDWRRLEHNEHFANFVQLARETALRPWLLHFDPEVDVHLLEAALRGGFQRRVHEVADWLPVPWRAAVRWVDCLPELPLARHRAAGGAVYSWMPPEAPVMSFDAAGADGPARVRLWRVHWEGLWPGQRSVRESEGLRRLHLQCEQVAAPTSGAATSADAIGHLELTLRRIFRQNQAAVSMAFTYLGLLWLEIARLRGDLVRRRLLGAATPGSSS